MGHYEFLLLLVFPKIRKYEIFELLNAFSFLYWIFSLVRMEKGCRYWFLKSWYLVTLVCFLIFTSNYISSCGWAGGTRTEQWVQWAAVSGRAGRSAGGRQQDSRETIWTKLPQRLHATGPRYPGNLHHHCTSKEQVRIQDHFLQHKLSAVSKVRVDRRIF